MIFDSLGQVRGQHQIEHQQLLPQAGWVEHDGVEIWNRTIEVIQGALKAANLKGSDLAAVGITNQRETAIAWDAQTGKPFHHAIVWQDLRTQDFLSKLTDHEKSQIEISTGLRIAPYFSASKMNWLLHNVPEITSALTRGTVRIGTIDSWLLWNLTGGTNGGKFYTDVTNASRTMLMNLVTLTWDEDLLSIFEIPKSVLAEIRSSAEIYGYTRIDGPFGAEIPIASMLGDQHAALVGQGCLERGKSKTTYGTGNFALLNTGSEIVRSQNGLLSTVAYQFAGQPAQYAVEGSVAVTGSAVQWLRDQLGIISSASEIEPLASSVTDTGGLYFVPAFSGLFAPYWRADARGVIVGMSRSTTKAHLARATLEAICYQTRDVIEAMAADTGIHIKSLHVDGGITANSLCMQMQADILGIEIVRASIMETTSLGAAYAAGLTVGFWGNEDPIRDHQYTSTSWVPQTDEQVRQNGYAKWKIAIERSLNWSVE